MKIRTKALLIAAFCGITTIGMSFLSANNIIMPKLKNAEAGEIAAYYQSIERTIGHEEASLAATAQNLAGLDDTYNFISQPNQEYIDAYLQNATIEPLNLNFVIYTGLSGELIFAKTFNLEPSLQEKFTENLLSVVDIAGHQNYYNNGQNHLAGLIVVDERAVSVSICPTTSSDGPADANGYLIMGSVISDEFIEYLEAITYVSFDLTVVNANDISDLINEDYVQSEVFGKSIWVRTTAENTRVVSMVEDIYGNPTIPLAFERSRLFYNSIRPIYNLLFLLFGCSLVVAVIISLFIVYRVVVRRLNVLQAFVNEIMRTKDLSARIEMSGTDEITALATSMNGMLRELDHAQRELQENEARRRLIMEATNDGYFDLDVPNNVLYLSPHWQVDIKGYSDGSNIITKEKYLSYIHPDDRESINKLLLDFGDSNLDKIQMEYRVLKSDLSYIWCLVRMKVIEVDAQGKPARVVGTVSDISERKKAEEDRRYLNETDPLTGLKNRKYVEQIWNDIDSLAAGSYQIILADVNGLKLINDSFGQESGNKVLRDVGLVIQACCSPDDIPIRWGGDEFLIYIKEKTDEYAENIIESIKQQWARSKDNLIQANISFGLASKSLKHPELSSVIQLAEKRMMRNKLLENTSQRNSILVSLENTLHEKNIETEEHIQRIKILCQLIGFRLGLKPNQLDELALLGSLHDIGKVGIPENILLKPDKLTAEEWEVMKKHTEIGYRIAASTPDL